MTPKRFILAQPATAQPASPGGRWEQFARAVQGRYLRTAVRVGGARMTLHSARSIVNRYELTFAALCPRIQLSVHWTFLTQPLASGRISTGEARMFVHNLTARAPAASSPHGETRQTGGQPLSPLARIFRELNARPAADRYAAAFAPVIARLTQLGRRVEDRQWAKPALATRAAAPDRSPSPADVERLASRAARSAAETVAAQTDDRAPYRPAAPLPTGNGAHRASAIPASPAEVEQLAEQVMRHIDRRMVAYRERMGRGF